MWICLLVLAPCVCKLLRTKDTRKITSRTRNSIVPQPPGKNRNKIKNGSHSPSSIVFCMKNLVDTTKSLFLSLKDQKVPEDYSVVSINSSPLIVPRLALVNQDVNWELESQWDSCMEQHTGKIFSWFSSSDNWKTGWKKGLSKITSFLRKTF